jgi:hypothetical protein
MNLVNKRLHSPWYGVLFIVMCYINFLLFQKEKEKAPLPTSQVQGPHLFSNQILGLTIMESIPNEIKCSFIMI